MVLQFHNSALPWCIAAFDADLFKSHALPFRVRAGLVLGSSGLVPWEAPFMIAKKRELFLSFFFSSSLASLQTYTSELACC